MKKKIILIVIAIIISIAINFFTFKNGHNWGDDFAAYIIQSQTIKNNSFDDLIFHIKHTKYILNYPWGYPMLLAPVIGHFETNINFLKMYTYCFFIISFIFIYLFFRNNDKEMALLTILMISVNPYFWEFKNNILADFPTLLFTYIALYLINLIYIQRAKLVNNYVSNALIGAAIFLSYLMRNQSIVLLPTLILIQLFTYKKQNIDPKNIIQNLLPYSTFITLVLIQRVINPIGAVPYLTHYRFHSITKIISSNLLYYTHVWNELFAQIFIISRISEIVVGAFLIFCLIGLTSNIRSNLLSIIFFIVNISLLVITPFHQGVRYLILIIPIFFYFGITGLYLFTSNFYPKYRTVLYYTIIGLFVIASFYSIIVLSLNNRKEKTIMAGPYEKESQEMFKYIKNNTNKSDIIAFCKPRIMLLYSGRDSTIVKYEHDLKRADYLVFYKYGDNQLNLNSSSSLKLDPKFENKNFKVFKIN